MPCKNSKCKSCCYKELPCGCKPCPPSSCCPCCCDPPPTCECSKLPGSLYKLPPKTEVECEPIKVTVTCGCKTSCCC